ncbi:hypothetical protein D0Z08_17735 [Nocardioides immobilis]|uniref:Uncharacterized protein n=1 Tax=Nocardioides immobilis TaxID=2049295 RepID=A0A417XZS4_9ACTN|nr:hypothetical protein [Nocardioides immobilis]RHW25873.1 hypothetical protein D0Z08_17735 [Nocardioides immobilis]
MRASAEQRAILGSMAELRVDVLLSMQRALWHVVLRGVGVSWEGSQDRGSINARFLYEGEVGGLQDECVSLAESYCIADFLSGVSVAFRAVLNATRDLLPGEEWVFLRWEPPV